MTLTTSQNFDNSAVCQATAAGSPLLTLLRLFLCLEELGREKMEKGHNHRERGGGKGEREREEVRETDRQINRQADRQT